MFASVKGIYIYYLNSEKDRNKKLIQFATRLGGHNNKMALYYKVRRARVAFDPNKKETKSALRRKFKKRRKTFAAEELSKISDLCCQRLAEIIEEDGGKNVALYYPIRREIDIKPLFDTLKELNLNIYYPKITADDRLIYGPVNDLDELEVGSFRIPEPTKEYITPDDLDIIIIPGLGFSFVTGARLGYGKGHYDRSLQTTKALKVGLTHDAFLTTEIPNEDHDILMDVIISENREKWIQK